MSHSPPAEGICWLFLEAQVGTEKRDFRKSPLNAQEKNRWVALPPRNMIPVTTLGAAQRALSTQWRA